MKYRFLMPDIRGLSDRIKPSKTNKGDGELLFLYGIGVIGAEPMI